MYPSQIALNDLSDINFAIINAIADSFIRKYGHLGVESGRPFDPKNEISMADEIQQMLSTPELGIRQIVPLIAMWIIEFDLNFNDPLYKMEFMRLQQRQVLADQIDNLLHLNRKVTIQFTVAEILSMLEPDELYQSLPYIEYQLFDTLPPEPKTLEELFSRVRALWQHSEKFIEIQLSPDLVKAHQNTPAELDTLEQARRWLNETQRKTHYNLNAFFKEYDKLDLKMKDAVNEVMDEKLTLLNQRYRRHEHSNRYGEGFRFYKELINKILQWFRIN